VKLFVVNALLHRLMAVGLFFFGFGLFSLDLQAIPMQYSLDLRVSPSSSSFTGTVKKNITIKIYPLGGSASIWTEVHHNVTVADGAFTVLVGSVDTVSNPLRSEYLETDVKFSVTIDNEEAFWVFNPGTVYALKSAVAEKALSVDWAQVQNQPTLADFGLVSSVNIASYAITNEKIATGAVTMSKLDSASATSGQVLKWTGSAWAPASDDGGTSYSAGSGITLSGTTFSLTTELGTIATRNQNDFVSTGNFTKSNLGLGNVENTALSTWTGSAAITRLGALVTGVSAPTANFSGAVSALSYSGDGSALTGVVATGIGNAAILPVQRS